MTGQASPYPSTPPPAPVYVPLDLYISERESDRHVWETARAEDRAWMASIARDVRRLVADLDQRTGAAGVEARHDAKDREVEATRDGRRWAVKLAAIAASIGAGIAALVDRLSGG